MVLPALEIIQEAAICAGEGFVFYGDTLTESGTYSVTFTSPGGCDSTIVLELHVLPVSQSTISATICAGESYPFGGQLLTAPGMYTVTLQNASGCDSTIILTLTVISINNAVALQGTTLTAAAGNATYQWLNCDGNQPITGANGQSFTPTVTGSYAVQITQNGCSVTSECTTVEVVGTRAPVLDLAWSIQPNPAVAVTRIEFGADTDKQLSVECYDVSGRLEFRTEISMGTTAVSLDLNALPAGVYLVRLTDGVQVSAMKRLVKMH
ncbi:MAG: T9SS type A sorting domain-containing protein [Alphaproteobacteria bacterium]